MKIVVISATHNRPLITKLFILGIKRLREYSGLDIPVIITGDSFPYVNIKDVFFIDQQNEPVSYKFQTSLNHAIELNPEYIMVMGSDNLIDNDTFSEYIRYMNAGIDYMGVQEVVYYSLEPQTVGQVKYQHSSIIVGAGRTFKASLVRKCKQYKLWDKPKNKSLDSMMFSNLRYNIDTTATIHGFVIDVKHMVNINNFGTWCLDSDLTENDVLGMLGEEEKVLINQIKSNEEIPY